MKKELFILNSLIVEKHLNNGIILTENDFHPCKPFFQNNKINPFSINKIYTKGVLEITPYLRELIRRVDDLLVINGTFEIDYFNYGHRDITNSKLRGLSLMMYEIALCFANRFLLIEQNCEKNIQHLVYKKISNRLPVDDSIDSWSFGIVSNGAKNEQVIRIINQIREFKIPKYEIIICGPNPFVIENYNNTDLKIFTDIDLQKDLRAPISSKKNRIIENSKYNNIVLMHDRISFPKEWYENITQYGNLFDILAIKILDEETKSKRVQDWMIFKGNLSDFKSNKAFMLSYNDWDSDIYVDGGFLIAKKHILDNIKYNNNLNWGEAEDVDLCKRLFLDGVLISLDIKNFVYTTTHRHNGSPLVDKRSKIRIKLGLIKYNLFRKRTNIELLFKNYIERY